MSKTFKTGWYVLYVKSCQEKKVHDLLQEDQLESFLPVVKTIRKWSDRKKIVFKPLFTSYVFVKINSPMDFHKALSVNGACAYIRFGSEYAIVKDQEILNIKLFLGSNELSDIETSNRSFKIGEIKKINYGSLSGLECEILKVNNTNKLIVRIDSLQQSIIATVPSCHIVDIHEVA
ncbi:UpxY family transcription antiterminator [Aquimarina litoralis]|uniref:UpxY family transcription antiterminator n=1 Tax=Aquimarina litoralis TaxID=584605 RepID=UPI001C571512|nr:UpxY family transcription antiterminator [Aquimarina litoralis]MBW1295659.1 UpxY family transcription antiterminator [Aquimarina litoralis]